MIHGIVLTSAPSITYVRNVLQAGGYNAIKVVTGWGMPVAWNRVTMMALGVVAPNIIVRTVQGDGVNKEMGKPKHPYLHWERVLAELTPWYHAIPQHVNLMFELGNEPEQADIFGYAWHLERSIDAIRRTLPRAKIISPALSPSNAHQLRIWAANERWRSVVSTCDYIGVHQYAFFNLITDDTRQFQLLDENIQNTKPWIVTEMGINDPGTPALQKVQRYAAYTDHLHRIGAVGAFDYHLCTQPRTEDDRRYALQVGSYA